MRDPNAVHVAHPLRMHELAPDFTVEDVWVLPAVGAAGDFPTLLDVFANLEFPRDVAADACPVGHPRLLGRCCCLGRINDAAGTDATLPIPGTSEVSLTDRLSTST